MPHSPAVPCAGGRAARLLAALAATALAAALAPTTLAGAALRPAFGSTALCPAPTVGRAACLARVLTSGGARVRPGTVGPYGTPSGYGPADLVSAYHLPTGASLGSGQTVAIVDAYDNPNVTGGGGTGDDLATYRSMFGLPACTTTGGCFTKLDEHGGTSYPAYDSGWAGEIDLDVEAVSAVCPACHILLVEAASSGLADLLTGVDTAVAAGATEVSLSWGGPEFSGEASYGDAHLDHPGIPIVVATGDSGYAGGVTYPSSSPYVIAAGGTTLTRAASTSRGWTETAWSGAGSGCSADEAKPAWQVDPGCPTRMVADIAALADPYTGVAMVYQQSWTVAGGTSLATPLVAAMYALENGSGAGAVGAAPIHNAAARGATASFNDVTAGSNGPCSGAPAYFCTAGTGFDGPTGWGSPVATPPQAVAAVSAPSSVALAARLGGSGQAVVRMTSSGLQNVAVSGVTVTGASDVAATTDTCTGAVLAPGATCSVTLTFTPHATGGQAATVAFADNAGTGEQDVAVTATGLPPAPAAVGVAAAQGTDNALWVRRPSGGWASLGGSIVAAPAMAALPGGNHLYVATGLDQHVWQRTDTSGWQALSPGALCTDNPGLLVAGSTATVACTGGDRQMWTMTGTVATSGTVTPATGWAPQGGLFQSGPAITTVGGQTTLMGVGLNGTLWSRTPASGWHDTGWACIGHAGFAVTGGVTYFGCDGLDHQLWVARTTGSAWGAAHGLGGLLQDGVGVVADATGARYYAQGQDPQVWTIATWPDTTPYGGWTALGGVVRHGAAAA